MTRTRPFPDMTDRRRRRLPLLAAVLLLASGCSGGEAGSPDPAAASQRPTAASPSPSTASPSPSTTSPTATAVPADRAVVPDGWTVEQGPGFSIATPPEWERRPDDLRLAPEAALEVGVPYTGQPVALPLLLAFVEREQVGPLDVREPLLRLQLEQGLPDGAVLGPSREVEVAGASGALVLDAVYSTKGGTSVTGDPIAPITVRQRELVVETPGLPKYGLRFTAPADAFPEDVWAAVLGSLVVTPG